MLGQPIFPGDSGVDQLVEIIKVLGTPTREQVGKVALSIDQNSLRHSLPLFFRSKR